MPRSLNRLPLLVLAMLSLFGALWAGWLRLGWDWPVLLSALPLSHGPLMVSGFFGTLISLERAVALNRRWMYAGPLLCGLGGLLLMAGLPTAWGALALALGSLALLAIFVVILRQHLALYTVVMALGVLCWVTGSLIWLAGQPVYQVVLWWQAFLVLTIAGERLELGRVLRLSRRIEALFAAAALLFLAGVLLSAWFPIPGARLAGLGLLLLALWLLRWDIARHTIRKTGLPRFVAAALLAGYVWLGLAGLLALRYGALVAGPLYDAYLHAIFIGFVVSMVFGHAPIIFPAVLGLPVRYRPAFYLPLLLLHASLLLRVAGDFLLLQPLRLWGGLLNGIAILLYLWMVGVGMVRKES